MSTRSRAAKRPRTQTATPNPAASGVLLGGVSGDRAARMLQRMHQMDHLHDLNMYAPDEKGGLQLVTAHRLVMAAASERLEKTVARRDADFKEGQPGADVRFDEGEYVGSMDACELRAIVAYAYVAAATCRAEKRGAAAAEASSSAVLVLAAGSLPADANAYQTFARSRGETGSSERFLPSRSRSASRQNRTAALSRARHASSADASRRRSLTLLAELAATFSMAPATSLGDMRERARAFSSDASRTSPVSGARHHWAVARDSVFDPLS